MTQVRVAHPTEEASLRELLFLQRLSKAAASTIEPDALLELIINETTGAMQVEVCSLYLYEPETEDVILTATNGLDAGSVGKARLKVGAGVTGWVAQHLQALVVPDVTQEPRFQWLRGVDQKRLVAMLSVPILAGSRMIGVVNVQSEERRDFGKADIDFLGAIAGQVAGIIERSELQRRLQAQLEEIRGSQAIHERFTQLALSGAGTGAIMEAIESLRDAPVELFDPAGFRLERPGARSVGGRAAGVGIARLEVPSSILASTSPESIEITAGRPPRQLSLTPIRAGDELLAVLAADAVEDEAPNQRRALEHGATVLSLELAKERAAAEVERRLRGDLVEELLGHGLERGESVRLAAQAERLGHRLSNRSWVLVVEPDDEAGSTALESLASELILTTLHRVVKDGSFSLGIGNNTSEVYELPRAHDEARQSLRLARRGGATRRVASYRNLGAFRLLLEVQNPVALARFVDETLGPLLRYQEGRRTPLIETLEQLSAEHWNRRAAARGLHLHVNSLSYRIQRIEALLGVSLEDAETRVALSIALRARSLLPT